MGARVRHQDCWDGLLTPVNWINAPLKGRLAIMARPRAGDWLQDEISNWRAEGIEIVVSLLEPDEVLELGLSEEASLCSNANIEFLSFPILDRGVPYSPSKTAELARSLVTQIHSGKSIAIHCRAGIGRSALIAGCILVSTGIKAGEAFELVAAARGLKVPDTDAQIRWLHDFSNAGNSI